MESKTKDSALRKVNRTRFITVAELSDFLKVPQTWIYDRTGPHATDRIPHFKMGKYLRFDTTSPDFEEWLQRNFQK